MSPGTLSSGGSRTGHGGDVTGDGEVFPVVEVDRLHADAVEPLGTKSKFWYRVEDKRILFKAEERGTGEDWAEKVACELSQLLGMPHVRYDLAIEKEQGSPGVVCENWGALKDADGALSLAPTFDHGASLARNVSDDEKHDRMTTRDRGRQIETFARRARSAFFADRSKKRPLSTVQAWRMFAAHVPDEARAWLQRLEALDVASIEQQLSYVPPQRMSAVCREFTLHLLVENRKRLLNEESL